MMKRRRFKQELSLQDRLTAFAGDMRQKAAKATSPIERDNLLKRARQADIAKDTDEWAHSPGLQSPK